MHNSTKRVFVLQTAGDVMEQMVEMINSLGD